MTDTLSKSINIKVTAKERKAIGAMADKDDLTLKDLVLDSTIYSTKDTVIADLTNEVDQLKGIGKELEQANSRIVQLEGVLTAKDEQLESVLIAKDEHIDNLNQQLEQANKRIDDYSRQLEQQQALQLTSQSMLEQLQLESDTKKSKGWFSRLFSND